MENIHLALGPNQFNGHVMNIPRQAYIIFKELKRKPVKIHFELPENETISNINLRKGTYFIKMGKKYYKMIVKGLQY